MSNTLLKNLRIEHYRGFFEQQTLEFATPNGRPGSGLTLIVGPNNTGKTTIIESLLFAQSNNTTPRFAEHDRHKNKTSIIRMCWQNKTGVEFSVSFSHIPDHSLVLVMPNQHEARPKGDLRFILAKREWDTFDNSINTSGDTLGLGSGGIYNMGQILNRYKTLKHYGSTGMLGSLSGLEEEQKSIINSHMKKLVPNFEDWTIDTNESGDYVKYRTADGGSHRAQFLGSGVLSLLFICRELLNLENGSGDVLIIDEPELSLHPETQKQLAGMFSQASSKNQLIICTHSPYFADWFDFTRGAKFVRLNKTQLDGSKERKCVISELDLKTKYGEFITNNLSEYQKPQLLDVVAKEILFANKILFVEGQEDVGVLRNWLCENYKNVSFSIFGYGVGGHGHMKLFLELSRDLGLQKVSALYDGDEEASKSYEKDRVEFKEEGYALFQLPTEDIRDKRFIKCCKECSTCTKCEKKKSKEGCFNEDGQLKPEFEKAFRKTMQAIVEFFDKSP